MYLLGTSERHGVHIKMNKSWTSQVPVTCIIRKIDQLGHRSH